MKNLKIVMFVLALTFVFVASGIAIAATSPSLGSSSTYGVLGSTYTNTAGTTISGDVGYTTPPAVTPTINGTTHVADASYNQAGIDQGSALGTLNSQSCDFNFNSPTDLSLLSQPLVPGVYCITAATSIGTGGITLNGAGTYVFRIKGALTTLANSAVTLAGGASACNVFWTPTQATTLGANSTFLGTDIDASGITVGSTVNWTGRALAFGGTVTTNTDTISVPSCSAPVVIPPTPTLVPPLISITKVPTLLSLLSAGGGSVAFDYAVSNPGTVAMSNITACDNRCSPVNYISGDTNNNLILEVGEVWHYRCTTNVTQNTTNIATAPGQANGFTATDTATANVVVNVAAVVVTPPPVVITPPVTTPVVIPTLPKTGFPPQEKSSAASYALILSGILAFSLFLYAVQKKQNI